MFRSHIIVIVIITVNLSMHLCTINYIRNACVYHSMCGCHCGLIEIEAVGKCMHVAVLLFAVFFFIVIFIFDFSCVEV